MRIALCATLATCLLRGIVGIATDKSMFNVQPDGQVNAQGSIVQTLRRMQYWSHAGTPIPPGDRYLLFDYDGAGLNNIRIAWEFSGVIAKLTGRTFVIPPPERMYLLDYGPRNKKYLPHPELDDKKRMPENSTTVTGMEDLVNMKQLRANIPTMTAAQFEQRTGLSWSAAKEQAERLVTKGPQKELGGLDEQSLECDNVAKYQAINSKFLHMVGWSPSRGVSPYGALEGRREGFHCGEWWTRGGPKWNLRKHMGDGEWALLQHGFVWHEDAFDIAAKAVHYLSLFDYVAVHARYNDFGETQAQQGAHQLLEHWKEYLPAGSTLYVATDDANKVRNHAPDGVRLVLWDDFFSDVTGNLLVETKAKYSPERWFKLIGLVEELICTYSRVFVGTDRSSFTGHIQRMRTHVGAPTSARIVHKDGVTLKVNGPGDFPGVRKEIEEWKKNDMKHNFKPMDQNHGSSFLQIGQETQ